MRLAEDEITRRKIDDMIRDRSKRGGRLPAAEDVRRRLGAGQAPGAPGVTFAQAWEAFISGNKRMKRSARERLEQIGEHWLLPVLADVPLERLNGAHCVAVFERVDAINRALVAAHADGTKSFVTVLDDVRSRPRPVGVATQHRASSARYARC